MFLPRKVKIAFEAKYANVENYATGGATKPCGTMAVGGMAKGGSPKAIKELADAERILHYIVIDDRPARRKYSFVKETVNKFGDAGAKKIVANIGNTIESFVFSNVSIKKDQKLYDNLTSLQHQLKYLLSKDKMAVGGMAKGGNLRAIAKKYEENEDENMHSENVVLLAKHFGTPEELKQAKQILATHEKEGSLSTENGAKKRELSLKLIGKAREEMAKEGISFAKGGTAASIDYKDYIGRKMDEYRRSMGGTYEDFVHYALRDLGLENQGKIDKKKMDSVISEVSAKNPRFKKAWLSFKKDSEMYVKGTDYINPYQENYKQGGTMNKAWSRKIDKSMKAKRAGYRKSKETGNYYYEDRPNRSDKDPQARYAKGGAMRDNNLANNYPPYDKVTRGDVIAGRLGQDQMGGKNKMEMGGKMYAKGGMSEHGLKTGDKIVGKSGGMGVKVYNKESREAGTINLDKGSRNVSKYAKGGYMAKGGKAKKKEKDPPIVRGYMDDEPYEYGQGGSAGCWCYEIGGL